MPAVHFGSANRRFQRSRDGIGDLILNGKDVIEIAIVAFGPYVMPVLRVDQLASDADTVPGFSDAAFQDISCSQSLTNGLHLYGLSFVGEARVTGYHRKPPPHGKPGKDVLSESIGKEFLLRVSAQIVER